MLQVRLPYSATFGIEVKNGVVKVAAPIGRWMVGKNIKFVREWVYRKGGDVTALPAPPKEG